MSASACCPRSSGVPDGTGEEADTRAVRTGAVVVGCGRAVVGVVLTGRGAAVVGGATVVGGAGATVVVVDATVADGGAATAASWVPCPKASTPRVAPTATTTVAPRVKSWT